MPDTPQFVSPTPETSQECHAWFKLVLDAVRPGWIAGGCLRDYFSRTPCTSDLDVFFASPDDLSEGISRIEEAEAERIYDHPNIRGYLLNGKHVQLVKNRFFESPEATIDRFDFTVCCCAIDSDGRIVMHPRFLEDLAARRLVLHNLTSVGGTMARLSRYAEKGFEIDKGLLLEIALTIRSPKFDESELNGLAFYGDGNPRHGMFENNWRDDEEIHLAESAKYRLNTMLEEIGQIAG